VILFGTFRVVEQHQGRRIRFAHHLDDVFEGSLQSCGVCFREPSQSFGQLALRDRRRRLSQRGPTARGERELHPSRIRRGADSFHQTTVDQPPDDHGNRALIRSGFVGKVLDPDRPASRSKRGQNKKLGAGQIEIACGSMRASKRMHDSPERIHDRVHD